MGQQHSLIWGGMRPKNVTLLVEKPDAAARVTRSCSGCYSEVEPEWRVCKICGELLIDGATHVTRTPMPRASFALDVEHFMDHVRKVPPGGF